MERVQTNRLFRGSQRGLSLIEQIIALAVLAILCTMAIPHLHRMREGHVLRLAQAQYMAALQHARSLAVNEQTRVIVCPSHDALHCSGDDAWNHGWLVGRVDPDNKNQPLGPPRYSGQNRDDMLVITSNGAQKHLWFGPDGSAVNTFQTLLFCMKDAPERVLKLTISRTGRVRGEQVQESDASPCAPKE